MHNLLIDGSGEKGVLVFAHGSGIAMDHSFMQQVTTRLVAIGLKVVRFEFPYMANRRLTDKKGFPDKLPILQDSFLNVIEEVKDNILYPGQPLFIAGKSLGGRVATIVAPNSSAQKVFVFGYPFHPVNNVTNLRLSHLQTSDNEIHIFQGERDKFGDYSQVSNYALSDSVHVHWLTDGDHDLKPRKSSGVTHTENLDKLAQSIQLLL